MKHQIKNRYTGDVIYECDVPDDLPSGMRARHALESAVRGGANLDGTNLRGAHLSGAYLRDANLSGAKVGGKTVAGKRPVFQIGPIGSRSDYLVAINTDAGIVIRTGCFNGSIDEFLKKLESEHGDNIHAREYKAALVLIEMHFAIWGAEETKGGAR